MIADILPYVETLKWPGVVLVCFGVVIICFRQQVAAFLGRVDSVGKDGLKAAPLTQLEQQAKQEIEREKSKNVQELSQAFSSLAVREREGLIKAELQKRHLDYSGDTVDILVTHLAHALIALHFEQTYKVIFGSQIYILKQVNTKGMVTEGELAAHFEHVKKLFAPSFNTWAVESYILYVVNSGLIKKDGGVYVLTTLGFEFLPWIVRRGYSETPPL